jgi:dipeptidyl aminopeptidase/acylaminoacyl peptidase
VEIQIKHANGKYFWDGVDWVSEERSLVATGTLNWSYDTTMVRWVTDRRYIIISKAFDNIGNIEKELVKNVFMFDNKPPESLTIDLKDAAVTESNYILLLSLFAIDTGSELHQMSFSNDNILWSSWENYSTEKIFPLPIPRLAAEERIYFRVSDRAGNIAEPVHLDITPENLGLYIDSDNDSVPDNFDAFPEDPTEWVDTDGDGVGDNGDAFPTDPAASVDTDHDGAPDFWNIDKSEEDSTTGLYLDAFPTDIAASVDSDGDKYPDRWNVGKSKKDSTTGLKLDQYPNDPSRYKKESGYFEILLVFIVILLLVIIGIVTSVLRKRSRRRRLHPFVEERVLREVRDDIIDGKVPMTTSLLLEKDRLRLQEMYERGEISESAYQIIKEFEIAPDMTEE